MSPPLFSVVIPAYNAALFIEAALDSIRSQTCRDYEVIVVDDGSRDDTKGIVDRWISRHGLPARCIRQENKKIAGARNTGMRAAAGTYIALLDHDDLWYPGKLAAAAQAIEEHPDAVLIGHHIDVRRDGRPARTLRRRPDASRMYEWLLFNGPAVSTSAAVIRRDKALEIGGFRENPEFDTVEDYDFWMRLSLVGPFIFLDQVLAEYAVVENSASSRVEYHQANLESLLRNHFASYFKGSPGLRQRWMMRRRLATTYRGAAGALAHAGAPRSQRWPYIRRMLLTYPFAPRNIARALLWLIGK